jgi:hypothetical protein
MPAVAPRRSIVSSERSISRSIRVPLPDRLVCRLLIAPWRSAHASSSVLISAPLPPECDTDDARSRCGSGLQLRRSTAERRLEAFRNERIEGSRQEPQRKQTTRRPFRPTRSSCHSSPTCPTRSPRLLNPHPNCPPKRPSDRQTVRQHDHCPGQSPDPDLGRSHSSNKHPPSPPSRSLSTRQAQQAFSRLGLHQGSRPVSRVKRTRRVWPCASAKTLGSGSELASMGSGSIGRRPAFGWRAGRCWSTLRRRMSPSGLAGTSLRISPTLPVRRSVRQRP